MILSLYLMSLCFNAYVMLASYPETKLSLILFALGIAFFFIASACYDRTITKLSNEIGELRKEIQKLKGE